MTVMEDGHTVRVVLTEHELGPATEPALEDLRRVLTRVFGTDFGVHSPTWISRFTDATRQAACYRCGRVLLAGDAAHIHSPAGGQGIGLGIQDAVNLGWKLAQVVAGVSADALLDTYHAERHPAGARSLGYTMAQSLLQKQDVRTSALNGLIGELLGFSESRSLVAGLVSGLDVAYDLGEGHPLLGRRMPDLDLVTPAGPLRTYTLLHRARPFLLDLGVPGELDVAAWSDRVPLVEATYSGPWELPVVGSVSAPSAILVRPDGHVAWVGEDGTRAGLREALTRWFGAPQAG